MTKNNNNAEVNIEKAKQELKNGLIKQEEKPANLRSGKTPEDKKPESAQDPNKRKPFKASVFSSAQKTKLDKFKKRRGL